MMGTKLQKINKSISDNKPAILTTMGCVGVVATTGLAIQATPYAIKAMEGVHEAETKVEKTKVFVRDVLPCYLPTILSGAASIGCILASHKELTKRNLITAGLYAASEQTLMKYQEKVIDRLGETKEKEIRDEMAADTLKANPMNESNVYVTGKESHWVYDSYSGRYFRCDLETIRKAVNDTNARVFSELYTTLNDFYFDIGLPALQMGDSVGWSGDSGYLEVEYTARLNDNGEPCIVIYYNVNPLR